MLYRKYNVIMENGDTREALASGGDTVTVSRKDIKAKIVATGDVVQLNENPNGPFSFNLAISRGPKKEPIYINRIAIRDDEPYLDAFRRMPLGQQISCEISVTVSDRANAEGVPYEDYWLQVFEWGRKPRPKRV